MKNENNFDKGISVYAVLALAIAVLWVVIFNNIIMGIVFAALAAVVSFFAFLHQNKRTINIRKYEK
ncbi:MAG: hypothetical protein IJB68_09215 [Ruminococcus sp.]|nr:hypothetical protein [Ruminococcus sp.]